MVEGINSMHTFTSIGCPGRILEFASDHKLFSYLKVNKLFESVVGGGLLPNTCLGDPHIVYPAFRKSAISTGSCYPSGDSSLKLI